MSDKTHLIPPLTAACLVGDAGACAAFFTEDGEIATSLARVKGRAAIRDFYQGWFDAYSDIENREEMWQEGDEVVVLAVNRMTQTGPAVLPDGETLPPNRRRIRLFTAERYAFEGDLIKKA